MQTKAQLKATNKYNAKTYTHITINIKNTDEDVIKILKMQKVKATILLSLSKRILINKREGLIMAKEFVIKVDKRKKKF